MGAPSSPSPCDADLQKLIQTIKQACRQEAIDAYEDAQIRGLCAQGAFEVAMQAVLDAAIPLEVAMSGHSASSDDSVSLKRVYESPANSDGVRVLVDRLWPRGLAKEDAKVDHWLKEIAPSDALRKSFHHDPDHWSDFQKRYNAELKDNASEQLQQLQDLASQGPLTLVYAAKDEAHNNAVVLKAWLKRHQGKHARQ